MSNAPTGRSPATEAPKGPPDRLIGTVLDGKYRLDRVLAKGGAGRVYVGMQLNLNRPVAVKVLRPELDADGEQRFEERFFREASMAGKLQHPHVVTVHDYGRTDDGTRYIAMELLAGRSLKERMRQGPIPPDEALPLFEQIVRGLRRAHRAGMIHRDMKPGNVQLVPGEDGASFAKILDFGLVRGDDADAEITRDGYFVGTPHYAAPEQVKGIDVDGRADLYSVGIMLYRALCGRLPFWSKDGMAIAISQVQDPYPPMIERAPEVAVPPELEAIARRCMEKAPADRYPDCSALLQDLRQARRFIDPGLAATDETSVSTVSTVHPAIPPVQPRGRGGLLAGAVVGALALIAGGVATWSVYGPGAAVPVDLAPIALTVEPSDGSAAVLAEEPAAPEPPPPRSVTILISSEPAGAEVLLDGAVLGVTPLADAITVQSGLDQAERRFTLRKRGYDNGELVLDVSAPQAVGNVKLRRSAPSPVTSSAPTTTAAAPSAAPPAPAGRANVTADGVEFTRLQARRAVDLLNSADKDALLGLGMAPRQANIVIRERPFVSVEAFAATPYIGEKTVQALIDGVR